LQLKGEKYLLVNYYGALMPKTITKEDASEILEALASLATAW
jgi:hypothetical protein